MKRTTFLAAVAILATLPLSIASANEDILVRTQPTAVMDAQAQAQANKEADDLLEDRVPEKREILDLKNEEARGQTNGRIQSFENEENVGMRASATTRIDMR